MGREILGFTGGEIRKPCIILQGEEIYALQREPCITGGGEIQVFLYREGRPLLYKEGRS